MQRDLVVRSMDGDREAFTELGRIWIDRLYAAARLVLIDQHRAEDATQEALLALPYAYGKLEIHGRAAIHYGRALDAFSAEIEKLTESSTKAPTKPAVRKPWARSSSARVSASSSR
mgnify:CR=1 FL=1